MKHEDIVKKLANEINDIINNKEDWKVTLLGNNELLNKVEILLNEICETYTENIEND